MIICRQAKQEDCTAMMAIVNQAKAYFKAQGIDQWQKGYPDTATLLADISENKAYILEEETEDSKKVLATVYLSFDDENRYDDLHQGEWLNTESYGVVHRIAVAGDEKGRGIAGLLMEQLEIMCRVNQAGSIKIDTHRDNLSMQQFLKKSGFTYCGIIYLEDGDERMAFEKLVK